MTEHSPYYPLAPRGDGDTLVVEATLRFLQCDVAFLRLDALSLGETRQDVYNSARSPVLLNHEPCLRETGGSVVGLQVGRMFCDKD